MASTERFRVSSHQEFDELRRLLIQSQLDWVRTIEQLDVTTAERLLAGRLHRDVAAARDRLNLPSRWSGMPRNVERMMRRPGELVRFARVSDIIRDSDHILDIGCGHGVVAACIARRHSLGRYLGVDLSEPNIESARRMCEANNLLGLLDFCVADASELSGALLDDVQPTVALMLEVLEHLRDPIGTLRSIADRLPDSTVVVFSVPLLGRIEACWGHRTVFGADGIRGMTEGAGLELLHVEELHNTWALCAALRDPSSAALHAGRFAKAQPPARLPRTMTPVRLDSVAVNAQASTVSSNPPRLLVTARDSEATVAFSAPSAAILRIELEVEKGPLELTVELLDGSGKVQANWQSRGRSLPSRRTTMVLRPGWPSADLMCSDVRPTDSEPSLAIIRLRPLQHEASVVFLRIAYGASDSFDPVIRFSPAPDGPARSSARRAVDRVISPPSGETRMQSAAHVIRTVAHRSVDPIKKYATRSHRHLLGSRPQGSGDEPDPT